jgi:hypothetical protein
MAKNKGKASELCAPGEHEWFDAPEAGVQMCKGCPAMRDLAPEYTATNEWQDGYKEGHDEGFKCGLKTGYEKARADAPKFPQGLSPLHYSIELRDLFAMTAMNAMIQADGEWGPGTATWAYEMADFMLEARESTRQ